MSIHGIYGSNWRVSECTSRTKRPKVHDGTLRSNHQNVGKCGAKYIPKVYHRLYQGIKIAIR